MNNQNIVQALISGSVIFGLCILGVLAKAPPALALFVYFLPGFSFGIVLADSKEISTQRKKIALVLLSILIYSVSIFTIDVKHFDGTRASVSLILASAFGAMALSLSYDVLCKRKLKAVDTFLYPSLFGFISSLLSAFCLYSLSEETFQENYTEELVNLGIYSIYPVWQPLFIFSKLKRTTLA